MPAEVDARWFVYAVPALLLANLMLNSLRIGRLTSVVGALVASAVFTVIVVREDGYHQVPRRGGA